LLELPHLVTSGANKAVVENGVSVKKIIVLRYYGTNLLVTGHSVFHWEFDTEQRKYPSASGVNYSLRLLEFGKGNAPSQLPDTELDVTEAYSLLSQSV